MYTQNKLNLSLLEVLTDFLTFNFITTKNSSWSRAVFVTVIHYLALLKLALSMLTEVGTHFKTRFTFLFLAQLYNITKFCVTFFNH